MLSGTKLYLHFARPSKSSSPTIVLKSINGTAQKTPAVR